MQSQHDELPLCRGNWGHQRWFPGLYSSYMFSCPLCQHLALTLSLCSSAHPLHGSPGPCSTDIYPLNGLVTALPPDYTPEPICLFAITKDTPEKMVCLYRFLTPCHHSSHCSFHKWFNKSNGLKNIIGEAVRWIGGGGGEVKMVKEGLGKGSS